MTSTDDIEPISPSGVISRLQSGEFKLGTNSFFYSQLKTRRQVVEFLKKGLIMTQYDLIYVLLFLSGSSMAEARDLTNGFVQVGTAGQHCNPGPLEGRGFGLFRLNCNHLDIFKDHPAKQCVFSTDDGETWTGIVGQKLVTRPIKSWIACLYDGLYSSIIYNYKTSYFAHDIRRWGFYEPVVGSWSLREGKIYQADHRSLDELELVMYQTSSDLITGDYVQERTDLLLPVGQVKRKSPDGEVELQRREKRLKIDSSTGTDAD